MFWQRFLWICGLWAVVGRFCAVVLIGVFVSGCTPKSPKNISDASKNANLAKVTINISSQVDGYKKQKSVLTYWCKLESTTDFAQDFGIDSKSQSPLESKLAQTTPHCKAVGGANAFFRAMKTSRFRAPRDEVVELEAGLYYLAAFEIETKRNIVSSCDEIATKGAKNAKKCSGWDYEKNEPKFLAFSVRENLVLPKVKIWLKDTTQESATTQNKQNKKAKKSKQDTPKEVVFIISGDFGDENDDVQKKQKEAQTHIQNDLAKNDLQDKIHDDLGDNLQKGEKNHSHKAESKRGNAIFSLGSNVRVDFANAQEKAQD